jgi:hypothetical protein
MPTRSVMRFVQTTYFLKWIMTRSGSRGGIWKCA